MRKILYFFRIILLVGICTIKAAAFPGTTTERIGVRVEIDDGIKKPAKSFQFSELPKKISTSGRSCSLEFIAPSSQNRIPGSSFIFECEGFILFLMCPELMTADVLPVGILGLHQKGKTHKPSFIQIFCEKTKAVTH